MTRELILVTGGARSGKSAYAQELALKRNERTLFLATAQPGDAEMAERIARHRRLRPQGWLTIEEHLDLVAAYARIPSDVEMVIVDCLTLWVSNVLLAKDSHIEDVNRAGRIQEEILHQAEKLLAAYDKGKASLIVVTNEVGMGLVPDTPIGRVFRDALGRVNQLFASKADLVYLMVAGLPMEVKSRRPF